MTKSASRLADVQMS